ncbi:hypothetical protein FS837_003666 [Tulasnella sp. UAMH 9824]|nr:hypothetical protein FS837_003666 [Tulasnella sp. UAMH 9824]
MDVGPPDILNLAGVPGLGVAAAAVELLEAGPNEALIYREQCKCLCTKASALLVALNDQNQRDLHNVAVKDAASEIELVCNSAYKRMQGWRRLSRVKAFLSRDEIRADLEKLEKRLELPARRLSMETVREDEVHRGFAESQKRDLEELKGMLRTIIRDPNCLNEISTLRPAEVQSIIVSVQEELQDEQPKATQSPEHRQAKMELERGLREIRKRTGILPPLADLTKEVRRIDAPFDSYRNLDTWLGEWLGEQVALKALRNIGALDERAKNHFLREVEILRELQHRHVLRLYGICYFTPFVYLVSPLAVNANALQYVERNPEADRIRLLEGAASGLAYLHTRHPPVIHVLEDGKACISDFGLARVEEVAENTTNAGTSVITAGACRWMAPELVNPEVVFSSEPKRTTATDVWSFGMATFELFTGRRPYDHCAADVHVIQAIDKQFRHPRPRGIVEDKGLSDEVWDMMCRCWEQDPVGRPEMSEVAAFFGGRAVHTRLVSQHRDSSGNWVFGAVPAGDSRPSQDRTTPHKAAIGPHPNSLIDQRIVSGLRETSISEDEKEHDWPSTGPFEVHLSEDGKSVETATLDGVIRLLALSSASAFRDIRRTFFKVYPTFTDDGEVFESLNEQYRIAGHSGVDPQRRVKIRFNVIALMRAWIDLQPGVLNNGPVADRIRSFALSVMEPDALARRAMELQKLLRSPWRAPRSTLSTASVVAVYGDRSLKWSKLTPDEIATQLTAIESQLFRDITIIDCLAYFQGTKDTRGVKAFRDKNTRLSNWVQIILLKCPHVAMRSEVYKRFAQVASICRKMGNFSSMSAIVVALKSVAIDRLEETKRGVPRDIHRELQENSALLDNNNRAYQKMLKTYDGPVIPILHVHLHSIKYNYSSMQSIVKGSSGQTLINFKLYTQLLHRMDGLLWYQNSQFGISENLQHMKCIDDQLRSNSVQPDPSLDRWIEKKSEEVAEIERKDRQLFSKEIGPLRRGS